MKKIHILGAGGVGSWLTPSICLLAGPERVIVYDGDTLEAKNLNRQLFTNDDIGKNKAEALAARYGCAAVPKYYTHGEFEVGSGDWLLVGVDNNPARKSALDTCDIDGVLAICGANEKTSAEAYYYQRRWKDGPMDPRTYYPEIVTDQRFDPRSAAIGCTGEAQEQNRQLVSANFMAAALVQHLFVLWEVERKHQTRESMPHVPYLLRQNLTRFEVKKPIDHNKPKE